MRRTLIALAAMLFCLTPVADARMGRLEHMAWKRCERGRVIPCIHRAAIHRRVSYAQMLYIARRESGFDPSAKNPSSTASGLFQFLDTTWASTPYAWRSIWSAKWNALAAGWYMQRHGFGAWTCC